MKAFEKKCLDSRLLELTTFVEKYLRQRIKDGFQSKVHDFSHAYWVAAKAAELVEKEGGGIQDQKLAFIAGLFHDIVRPKPLLVNSFDEPPELQSAKIVVQKLSELGFSQKEIDEVQKAITGHSFGVEVSGNRQDIQTTRGLVAECVIAADKIRQLKPSIVKERAIYIKESIENPSKQQVVEYWKRRMEKTEDFLSSPAGERLLKHEPSLRKQFSLLKKYFREKILSS